MSLTDIDPKKDDISVDDTLSKDIKTATDECGTFAEETFASPTHADTSPSKVPEETESFNSAEDAENLKETECSDTAEKSNVANIIEAADRETAYEPTPTPTVEATAAYTDASANERTDNAIQSATPLTANDSNAANPYGAAFPSNNSNSFAPNIPPHIPPNEASTARQAYYPPNRQYPPQSNGYPPPPHGQSPHPGNSPYGNQPYGNQPYGNQPYGNQPYSNSPYGNSPYGNSPYGNSPYGNSPYGNSPYGNSPYSNSPYGNSPYGNSPYGNSPYGNSPYGNSPYGNSPYGGQPYGSPYFNRSPQKNIPPLSDTAYCDPTVPAAPLNTEITAPIPREKKPSAKHNAYRNEPSAASEVKRRFPMFFKGAEPLPGETPELNYARKEYERGIIASESKGLLGKSANKLSLLLLLYGAIFMVLSFTIPIIFQYFDVLSTDLGYTLYIAVMYILIYPATFPLLTYLGNLDETHKVKTFFKKPQCSPSYILKWAVIITGLAYAVNIVYTLISTPLFELLEIPELDTFQPFTSPLDIIINFVVLCVFAPVFEEILFRGVMLSNHMKFGAWHACVVTGLYFGLFHMNLQQFLYASVGGILLAMVVLKTGSIISSIIIHAMLNFINFFSLLTVYFLDNGDQMMTDPNWMPVGKPWAVVLYTFTNYLPILLILIALIMFIVELCINRHSMRLPKGDSGLTQKEKSRAFISSPIVIVTLIVFAALIIFQTFLLPIINAAAGE